MLRIAALLLALAAGLAPARAQQAEAPQPEDWPAVLAAAQGQTVYFAAWGGSPRINDYIRWVGERVAAEHGIRLEQVKLADTADAVAQVLAEKAAGRSEGGSIDLIWINGENFAAMKREGLLFGPFAEALPNFALVNVAGKPTTVLDFTQPVEGMESPWGMAQFVFLYDSAAVETPPASMPALLAWAEANPGRFTYPQPPDYIGSTFLKQALTELTPDPARLLRPVEAGDLAAATAPLWDFLDALHPHLWRGGDAFPASGPDQLRLLDDGELLLGLAFDPYAAASLIAEGRLPESVRVYTPDLGSIANTHFVAIPFNASAKEAAMVVADFLLSPEAQARKQDPRHWGSFTVLDLAKLAPDERALFAAVPQTPAMPAPDALGAALPEPHPSWMEAIEEAWLARYRGD